MNFNNKILFLLKWKSWLKGKIVIDYRQYSFGSKRINLKLINDRLTIRVGGGYMPIQEFLRLYTI